MKPIGLLTIIFILFLSNSTMLLSQNLSARVLDSISKQPIPYATVYLNGKGMITNEEGKFNFLLDESVTPSDSLFISCIGYETTGRPLNQYTSANILLNPKAIELREVIVSNKNYTADEIMELVEDHLEKNYANTYTKKRLFFRNSSFNRMVKTDYTIKKSTIKAFNQEFLDSIISTVPKSNSYYTEILGELTATTRKTNKSLTLSKLQSFMIKAKNWILKNWKKNSMISLKKMCGQILILK